MPYEPTPIIIYDDLQADPPLIPDQNTDAWGKANANFEDIAAAMAAIGGANIGLLSARPEAGNAGGFYFATDAPATLYFDTGTEWKATLTFGTSTGTAAQGNDSRFTDASNHIAATAPHSGHSLTGHNHDSAYTAAAHASAASPHSGHEVTSAKNAANGYCGLDANSKVSTNQLPAAVLGALNYQGTHDASGGTYPSNPAKGYYWVISVQGTISSKLYRVNDWLTYDGDAWDKIDNATVVASVNGKTGAVSLATADIADSTNARYCTDAQKTVIGNTSGTNSGNETTTTIGSLINGATAKTAPVDADYLGLMDSESSNPANVLKKLSWAYVKSVLKTYFDGLYPATNDARLSDARTPTSHNLIDATGHPVTGLTTGHVLKATGATAYGFGALSGSDVGLGNVTNAAQLTTAQLGAASGVASLNASTKVVEDPANATATPTASKIPIADGAGKLDGWITATPDAAAGTKGKIQLAGALSGTAASPTVVGIKESGGQALTIGAIADGQTLKRSGTSVAGSNPVYPTAWYYADISFAAKTVSGAADRYTALSPNVVQLDVGGVSLTLSSQATLDLSLGATWDTISGTDYRTAANRAGKDFYIYLCQPGSGTTPVIKVSANATYPSGYNASTSRKVGGFPCLCVAVGTISGHALTGYLAGDILPAGVWDLKFRATPCGNEGMVYDSKDGEWKDIYPPTSTGANTASIYATGTAVTVSRNWMDFVDDGLAIGKHLLRDAGFQSGAAGSNEETNIAGSAFPAGTGGYSDTAGRRMISSIGMESCCGHIWQWLDEQSARWDFTTSWNWYDLPGSKGSLYNGAGTGGSGDVKLLAGGGWGDAAYCGSRSRGAADYRWNAVASLGARFAARAIHK